MVDAVVVTLIGVLLTITIGAAIQYYRLIRRTQLEYDKARELVEDVVLSFNRELRRETSKLSSAAYRIEDNSAKTEAATKRIDTVEKKLVSMDTRLETAFVEDSRAVVALAENNNKMREMEGAQENMKVQIVDLQEQVQKLSVMPELKPEPVIPIKRDKAMAALTDTEIIVLEMLASEGAKTAPEIKERVQLSREHTARLMKKLYEEGYLERETGKIPFRYNVKKEMEKFLNKPENAQV